jgi:phytoene dehydrogenase-like protein
MTNAMTGADIVAVGSGHNGLVAAAYLAAAGKKVLVLERNAWFGGGVVSRELTLPGFRHDQHSMSHIFIQANPLLKNDELGLKSRYGLEYILPDAPMMSVFEDGVSPGVAAGRHLAADDRCLAVCAAGAGRRHPCDVRPEPRGP